MRSLFLRSIIIFSFLIMPLAACIVPEYKDFVIAGVEFVAEFFLFISVLSYCYKAKCQKYFDWSAISLCISILFILIADTLNSVYMVKAIENYEFISDCSYGLFAFFLMFFLFKKFSTSTRNFNEWFWIFLGTFLIDSFLSYRFLFLPYYHLAAVSTAWKISGGTYMFITIVIFSLILPFTFRITDRKSFWFLNLILLLLTSDFAIRYEDTFIHHASFSWAEIAWASSFIGLAWLIYFLKNEKYLFLPEESILAPFRSIRTMLTLSIGAANILLVIGALSIKLYSISTAIDITSLLLLLFIFWTIANEFSIWLAVDLRETLNHMFKSKEQLAADGIVQFQLEQVTAKNHIYEISKILESYNGLAEQTNRMMSLVTETNKKATMAEIAFQVSHDIRCPLAALDMAVKGLSELPENNRILIRSSISRIKDITNNLLQKNPKILFNEFKSDSITPNTLRSVQLLSSLIDRLISEKRMQFRTNINVEIDSTLDENSYGIFSEINTAEFLRLVSNLIDNAVESLSHKGRVIVSLTQTENYSIVSISDNGCGIPAEILSRLGSKGETFNKVNGSGLGIYHAKTTIDSWHGRLEIDSTVNSGTTVKIMLPLAKSAAWFVDHLHIIANTKIAILDDDISIHQIWNDRFEKANIKKANVEILHFSTPEQLSNWIKSNDTFIQQTLFLVDYEFLGLNQVGLDIIENFGIQSQSILVTSHYEEVELRARCKRLNVQFIPKDMAAFVPISVETEYNIDAILIDDDELIHLCWKQCANDKQKTIATFSSAEEFIKISKQYSKNTPIYLDVNLSHGVRGEIVAKELYLNGFKNIYLATGYDSSNFTKLDFIKGVIDKHPPFQFRF